MKHISTDNLRAFVTVVDLQSYTLAGERLGRSQPAISLQLKRLEQQLNARLLQRQGNRIRLTTAGQELYPSAQQLLSLNDQIIAQFSESALTGEVRLGIPSEFASTLLPSILGQFAASYPQVTLQVTSGLSRDLRLGASRGHFDVILSVAESAPEDAVLIKNDSLVWVAGNPDYKTQFPLPLVLAPEGCIYRRRALQSLRLQERGQSADPAGVKHDNFRITYTNSDLAGISSALRSNLGITVLARSSVPMELHELRLSSLPELGEIGIYIERHGHAGNLAADHLISYIQEALQH
ncbi:LysR family transcriptional regulator [Aliidiomarina minuta]|nr:LysR family transcriptional regulator [Aliidiomarina minuta]